MHTATPAAFRRWLIGLVASLVAATTTLLALAAAQVDLVGPPGSESFGQQAVVLDNGNIVVMGPGYYASSLITDRA